MDHRRIYASPELNFYITPLYDSRKIYLYICIYFIQCLMNVILTYDFICISILSLSLEKYFSGLILDLRPANETSLQSNTLSHWLGANLESALTSLFLSFLLCTLPLSTCLCISFLPLLMLRIYSFMYWQSGTSDPLVLMLVVGVRS